MKGTSEQESVPPVRPMEIIGEWGDGGERIGRAFVAAVVMGFMMMLGLLALMLFGPR